MGLETSTILLLVGGASTAYQIEETRSARRASERGARDRQQLEQKRADIRAARERAIQVRKARQARAAALASAQTGAGTGGSGLTGAQANINSQLASNIGFLESNRQISSQISDLNTRTAADVGRHQTNAGNAAAVTSITQSALDVFGEE